MRRFPHCFVALLVLAIAIAMPSRGASPTTRPRLDPHRYDKAIDAFDTADAKTPPPSEPTVFVGSSTFTKWKALPDEFKEFKAMNRAFGGSRLPDLLFYLDRVVIRYKPSAVVIYCGTNDLASGSSPEEVSDNTRQVVEKIHTQLPATRIFVLCSIPSPSRAKFIPEFDQANTLIRAYADQHPYVHYIDARFVWSDAKGQPDPKLYGLDRLHPNDAGYRLLVPILKAALDGTSATQPSGR